MQSFETELLTQEKNLSGLAAINRELIAKVEIIDSPQRVVLDMDSTEIPFYGDRRPVGETCAVLLAAIGRKPSDEAAVWEYGAADRHAAADWVGATGTPIG